MEPNQAQFNTSLWNSFHKISLNERLERLQRGCGLSDGEVELLSGQRRIAPELAENFIENVIGYFPIPLGVASHFRIDGRDLPIPMAVEETSIVAAASATAKWVRTHGNIRTYSKGRLMIGQIQLPQVKDPEFTKGVLQENRDELIELGNRALESLVRRGGGIQDLSVREIDRGDGTQMVVVHLHCDPCDAMGANMVTQVCEILKPAIEKLCHERVSLCILSNLCDGRMAGAEVVIRNVEPAVGHGVAEASLFARLDPYRAATHNKGVMNGMDPIVVATGNDWRAVEAGVHAYANRSGQYQPITHWTMEGADLHGRIEVPLAVGTVGGVTRNHPIAQIALKMMKVSSADALSRIIVAVGLVQNLGALKALSTVGLVKGHMALHTTNLAMAAGAEIHEIGLVRDRLNKILKVEKRINLTHARRALEEIRLGSPAR